METIEADVFIDVVGPQLRIESLRELRRCSKACRELVDSLLVHRTAWDGTLACLESGDLPALKYRFSRMTKV